MNRNDADWASLYSILSKAYGPQDWWPGGDDPFEVVVGAILTQRTTWTNAAKAVDALRRADALTPDAIGRLKKSDLEEIIKPAGFYRAKAATLQGFCARVNKAGGLTAFLRLPTNPLRSELLAIRGIGEETADAILVYAAAKARFVVDAYTRRLLERLAWIQASATYGEIQSHFENALPVDVAVYGELHALIVHHGKTHCRARPLCASCVLMDSCAHARRQENSS